jgi:hypothetical protein
MNYTNNSHTQLSTNNQTNTVMGEDDGLTYSPGGAPSSSLFQDGTAHMTGDILRPHGTFGTTKANNLPIREARADQEMSHQRLH